MIGDYAVGKTSLIKRYCEGYFSEKYKLTIGVDFAVKTVEWDEKTRVTLQVRAADIYLSASSISCWFVFLNWNFFSLLLSLCLPPSSPSLSQQSDKTKALGCGWSRTVTLYFITTRRFYVLSSNTT